VAARDVVIAGQDCVGGSSILGCGWRIVTCQFRGNKVLLHHNDNVTTMKREAFKGLLAAIRPARPKRRQPSLRLVVSNPMPNVVHARLHSRL
jgi:hypothetical protein